MYHKFKSRVELLDLAAHNTFNIGMVITLMIKYMHSFNYHAKWDSLINEDMVSSECPRCSMVESWDYVILCPKTRKYRADFVRKIKKDMIWSNIREISIDEVNFFIEDILIYLGQDNKDECTTN